MPRMGEDRDFSSFEDIEGYVDNDFDNEWLLGYAESHSIDFTDGSIVDKPDELFDTNDSYISSESNEDFVYVGNGRNYPKSLIEGTILFDSSSGRSFVVNDCNLSGGIILPNGIMTYDLVASPSFENAIISKTNSRVRPKSFKDYKKDKLTHLNIGDEIYDNYIIELWREKNSVYDIYNKLKLLDDSHYWTSKLKEHRLDLIADVIRNYEKSLIPKTIEKNTRKESRWSKYKRENPLYPWW